MTQDKTPIRHRPETRPGESTAVVVGLGVGLDPAFRDWLRAVLGAGTPAVSGCDQALQHLHKAAADLVVIDVDHLDVEPQRALRLLRDAAPLACLVGAARSRFESFAEELLLRAAGMQLLVPLDADGAEVGELLHEMAARPAALRADVERHARLMRCLSQFEAWSANSVKRLDEWVHEMRTPLGVIRGFAGNLIDGVYGPVAEPQVKVLKRITSASGLLSGVVEQVRDDLPAPPQVEAQGQPRREGGRTQLSLVDVAAEVRELFAPTAQAQGVEVDVEHGQVPKIWGERLRILQALVNLVKNALRFTPPGGKVSMLLEKAEHNGQPACRVNVVDTGKGIASQEIARIFDAGYTTGESEGHQGMGLAVVRQVLREHGGDLKVRSASGEGTRFQLVFPVDPRRRRQAVSLRILQDPDVVLEVLAELGRRRIPLSEPGGEPKIDQLCDDLLAGGPEVTVLAADRELCSRITKLFSSRKADPEDGFHAEDSHR